MGLLKQSRTLVSAYGAILALGMSHIALIVSPAASSVPPDTGGWELGHNEYPGYAVIDPTHTNVNVDSLVLACGEIHRRKGLQLELYLSTSGPLLPKGATIDDLNKVPRIEIVIDDQTFGADILFADHFVVVVDEHSGASTMISDRLLDAMERGRTMTIRLDLLADQADQVDGFDGEVVVDLQAGQGGAAVAAVRRCGAPQLWTERR